MKICLLGVPYDSGHYNIRMGAGPLRLLAPIQGGLINKGHEVSMRQIILADVSFPTEITTSFEINRNLAVQVREAKGRGELPMVVAGNCSTAVGTLAGLEDVGVIWFDCHGDYNTPETTIGGFLDGMSLAMVAGHCWKQLTASVPGFVPIAEDKITLLGARDFDPLETDNLSASGIRLITAEGIRQSGNGLPDSFPSVSSVYLHIDLDVIDPLYLNANTYAAPGGLSPEELSAVIKSIKQHYAIAAVAFTAYDPSSDKEGKIISIMDMLLTAICDM